MIIPPSVTAEYRNLLDPVYEDAKGSVQVVLAETAGMSLRERQDAFHDVLPTIGDASSDAVSVISSAFFDSLMEMQEVRRPVASDILQPMDPKVWHALIGWAFSDDSGGKSVLERGGEALLYSLLSGGLTRVLARVGGDTMVGNAEIQQELMKAQRVPQAGCCNFCGMLASRFGEYTKQSAGKVVGRGVPVGEGKGHGSFGKGRGLKPRGTQPIGEDYHDNCRCSVVIITEGNYAELQAQADKYYDAYREAADKVNDGLTLKSTPYEVGDGRTKNKYEWVKADGSSTTAKSRTREIVHAMDLLNPLDQ